LATRKIVHHGLDKTLSRQSHRRIDSRTPNYRVCRQPDPALESGLTLLGKGLEIRLRRKGLRRDVF
jgi:hypothetical protein